MKFKNFGKSKVSLPLPYLLKVQSDSWDRFWSKDLKELFLEVSPIRDYTGKELELWFTDYKLDNPKYKNDLEAKINNDSYEVSLRVKTKLVNLKTKEIKEQEVFLADFPLMTERGTFIVNGVERVAIAQLIRSPGAFITAKTVGGKNYFGAKIIPNRGAWLEFESEPSGFIGVKIDRKRKVAATTLLRAFGVETFDKELRATLEKDTAKTQAEAVVEIYRRLRPGDLATSDSAQELVNNMFFNFERYDLSKVGRWKTWQRLPELAKNRNKKGGKEEEVTIKDRVLKPEDIIAVIREIIKPNNTPGAKPDEIDHLGNRRVRRLNELMQNRMSTLDVFTLSPSQLINPRPVMAVVKEFFTSSQMSQFMDNENPLAELEHKRRLSATGPGG